MKFVFRTRGGSIKFWGLVEDSDIGCLSLVTVRMGYLFAFQFWYCELCVENWWGGREGAESIALLIFVLWHVFFFSFLLKYTLRYLYVSLIYMWTTAFIFSNRSHGLQKKLFIEENSFFSVDCKLMNYILYTHDVTSNLSRWNNGGNNFYKKDQ